MAETRPRCTPPIAEHGYTHALKSELIDCLTSQLLPLRLDSDSKTRVVNVLPDLLHRFALRADQRAFSMMWMGIVDFVNRCIPDITQGLRAALFADPDGEDDLSFHPEGQPVHSEKLRLSIERWLQTTRYESSEPDGVGKEVTGKSTSKLPDSDAMESEEDKSSHHERSAAFPSIHHNIGHGSAAFKWLLASIGTHLTLSPSSPEDSVTKLRKEIHQALLRGDPSNGRAPELPRTAIFECRWDLRDFIFNEYIQEDYAHNTLGDVITLTGSSTNAQATTCSMYLDQTWPCTGPSILAAVEEAVGTGISTRKQLPDGTRIALALLDDRLTLDIIAAADVIAEIGEVVAWLASALRPSGSNSSFGEVTYCSPFIKRTPLLQDQWTVKINIGFTATYETGPSTSNGSCWKNMFRSPVVVTGYPIRRRAQEGTGLEIPFNMMAGLIHTTHVNEFLGRLYIKGFSSMLVAVDRLDDAYVWHHLYKSDGSHISYLDAVENEPERQFHTQDLSAARHIVGWCSDVDVWAGSPHMNYTISPSGLPHAGRDFSLEKVAFTAGKYIGGGCTFDIGKKDTPIHVSKPSYIAKLRWIDQKYVVFWDEDDKRGWMVNGSSALLHLLRGSLEHSRSDKFRSQFLFDIGTLKDSNDHQHDSAIEVLLDPEHRRSPLYLHKEDSCIKTTKSPDGQTKTEIETKTTYTTLEDKVEELYECLEKIIEHKAKIESSKGPNAKPRLRRHLEGCDFRDLVTGRDPFYLRVATLTSHTYSWVELTRAVHAVTLFGKGFGDLLAPAPESNHNRASCPLWCTVPKKKHLLCVSIPDLKQIIQECGGNLSSNPVKITPSLTWPIFSHNSSPFASCKCEKQTGPSLPSETSHNRPVQQIVSSKLPSWVFPSSAARLDLTGCGNGAVIFGQTRNPGFHWTWPDIGDMVWTTKDTPHSSGDGDIPLLEYEPRSESVPAIEASNTGSDSISSTSQPASSPRSPNTPMTSRSTSTSAGRAITPTTGRTYDKSAGTSHKVPLTTRPPSEPSFAGTSPLEDSTSPVTGGAIHDESSSSEDTGTTQGSKNKGKGKAVRFNRILSLLQKD